MRPPPPGVASGPRPDPARGPRWPGGDRALAHRHRAPASRSRGPARPPRRLRLRRRPRGGARCQEEERKGFADDLFNDALKPFGLALDEHLIDDEKITVEKVLSLATESLLKGLPVPVVLAAPRATTAATRCCSRW